MSRTLFISDLHLDEERPATFHAFADFLARHGNCSALYILGDLFEAWVGDDDDAPLATQTAAALKSFSEQGPQLYLMRGNRDFLLGEHFADRAGATLLDEPALLDLYGSRALLLHGDSLCLADTDYQAYRTRVRDPDWQARVLSRPLSERHALARQMRAESRAASSNKPEHIMDVSREAVDRVMLENACELLIHGHTHRPAGHSEARGYRWVLGDWDQLGWVLEAGPRSIQLYNFDINQ